MRWPKGVREIDASPRRVSKFMAARFRNASLRGESRTQVGRADKNVNYGDFVRSRVSLKCNSKNTPGVVHPSNLYEYFCNLGDFFRDTNFDINNWRTVANYLKYLFPLNRLSLSSCVHWTMVNMIGVWRQPFTGHLSINISQANDLVILSRL